MNQTNIVTDASSDPNSYFVAPESDGTAADITELTAMSTLRGGGNADVFVFGSQGRARAFRQQIRAAIADKQDPDSFTAPQGKVIDNSVQGRPAPSCTPEKDSGGVGLPQSWWSRA